MFIKSFRLLNYKSYIDSELLEFGPGLNIIIGQNNSGKTALLEALTLRLTSTPNRSIKKLPNRFSKLEQPSNADITLALDKNELREFLEQVQSPLCLPEPGGESWNANLETVSSLIGSF
ncbi:MAG: AAA family ATPase [Trichocoleus desertorum ATA4-8-CV12]|jgi:AAA15 family ATPase/GTPase|nr:AAA family ATPase [Trichocoleus desertorum ATA4-8-CV12]